MVFVFDEDAESEELGEAGTGPELSAAAKTASKLFAQRLDGTAAQGGAPARSNFW